MKLFSGHPDDDHCCGEERCSLGERSLSTETDYAWVKHNIHKQRTIPSRRILPRTPPQIMGSSSSHIILPMPKTQQNPGPATTHTSSRPSIWQMLAGIVCALGAMLSRERKPPWQKV